MCWLARRCFITVVVPIATCQSTLPLAIILSTQERLPYKLNIESMQPGISIVDARNGKLLGKHLLSDELHQVSIRHLACAGNDEIWFASQYEGQRTEVDGMAGVISISKTLDSYRNGVSSKGLSLVDLPPTLQAQTTGYLSSVAVAGRQAIYTSAKGGVAFKVNRASAQIEESVTVWDCSGVAPACAQAASVDEPTDEPAQDSHTSLVTSGSGAIVQLTPEGLMDFSMHDIHWDNHLYRML